MTSRTLVYGYSNGNTWKNLRHFPLDDSRFLLIGY